MAKLNAVRPSLRKVTRSCPKEGTIFFVEFAFIPDTMGFLDNFEGSTFLSLRFPDDLVDPLELIVGKLKILQCVDVLFNLLYAAGANQDGSNSR